MAKSAHTEVLSGTNWTIERGFVSPGTAEMAGIEILGAIGARHETISHDHSQSNTGYEGYVIDGLDVVTKEEASAEGFPYKKLMIVRAALDPFRDPKLVRDHKRRPYREAFVNVTAPGGKIAQHRDGEPWSQIFVNLFGFVRVEIEDTRSGRFITDILRPGDAVKIDNPQKRRQRPLHEFTNISGHVRVSYGEQLCLNK